jgi:hypothetical protein
MQGDEDAVVWLVANYGPVVTVMFASEGFTQYKSGIFYEENCPKEQRNHAIV